MVLGDRRLDAAVSGLLIAHRCKLSVCGSWLKNVYVSLHVVSKYRFANYQGTSILSENVLNLVIILSTKSAKSEAKALGFGVSKYPLKTLKVKNSV